MFSLLLLFSSVFCLDWSDCLNGTGAFVIDSLATDPDPLVKGENATATISYTVASEISTLNCTATLKILIIPIFKASFDMCDYIDCPLAEGSYEQTFTAEIPSFTPSGTFGVELQCYDADDNENLCLKANLTITSS